MSKQDENVRSVIDTMKNNDTPTNNIFKVAKNDIFVVREDITAPRFLFFDCGEDKTATAKQNSVLREDKTAPQFFYAYGEDENKDPNLFFFAFGEFNAATITAPAAPECCGPKTPCCGKPHIAFGECCGKRQFRPKCCASATAQQLINALVCVAFFVW